MRCTHCHGRGVTDREGELIVCEECGGDGNVSCCEGAENTKCYCNSVEAHNKTFDPWRVNLNRLNGAER